MRWMLIATAALVTVALISGFDLYVSARQESEMHASGICVSNHSGQSLIFRAEATAGAEITGRLNDGEQLCVASTVAWGTGAVRVFESMEAVEGCSRLARAGQAERLLRYSSFDNCEWADR